jgi:hypothetical protein
MPQTLRFSQRGIVRVVSCASGSCLRSSSASIRSLARPVDSLFRRRAVRPMKRTDIPPSSPNNRVFQASSKDTPWKCPGFRNQTGRWPSVEIAHFHGWSEQKIHIRRVPGISMPGNRQRSNDQVVNSLRLQALDKLAQILA